MTINAPRPKSWAQIVHESPEIQAYWREIRESQPAPVDKPESPRCETCGDLGYVRPAGLTVDHPMFGKVVSCPNPTCPILAEQRRDRYDKMATMAQIPDAYQDLNFARWEKLWKADQKRANHDKLLTGKLEALGAALAFCDARERRYMITRADALTRVGLALPEDEDLTLVKRCSIVLTGDPGLGKTSLAASIAQRLLTEYMTQVIYLQLAEFLFALKERFKKKDEYEFGGDAEDEAEVLRMYQQAPVLIIDEFPDYRTEWQVAQVYQLINYRHNHQLPTVITTNLSAGQIIDIWGMPIGHRLQAMAHWYELTGHELRARNPTIQSA